MRSVAILLLSAALAACSSGGGSKSLSQGPRKAVSRMVVASVSGPGEYGGESAARALAEALSAGRFEAVAAADADTVVSGAELGLSGASPATLAELRRATEAQAVVFGTFAPKGDSLDLTVLDARSGDVLGRVRVKSDGAAFTSMREAARAAAAALAPLAKGRRGKATAPELDELPPP